MKKINFKSKKLWIVFLVIIVIVFLFSLFNSEEASRYETVIAEKGNLIQTVDVTGKVESANELSLHFETVGRIDSIRFEVGDTVKAGQWLANLSLTELNASVTQAQSSLNQKLAGATIEQINVSEKQIEAARVALNQAEGNLEDARSITENTINSKYANALNVLEDTYIKMYNAYTVVESIKSEHFTNNDQEGLTVRNNQEYQIKRPKDEFNLLINKAKETKDRSDIDLAISSSVSSLGKILEGLTIIRNICEEVTYQNKVSATQKSLLDTQKTSISATQIKLSSLENEISLLKIQNNNTINSANSAVNSAKAALELQYATYNSLVAEPRDIDVSYYEAILSQAVAARNKAIIFAPINGVITKINKKKGELISMNETMIEMLSPNYEINVDVPETDITKINLGDEAEVTLSALGRDNKFNGVVLRVDPSSTNIQDIVYYKVRVGINDDKEGLLKPGMSADILIKTDARENVVSVPSRAILTNNETGQRYVRVLKDGEVEEVVVELGLRADDSRVEVLSGLEGEEEIVLRVIY
ncbi:MAG: efflux RND transporter periplasmic adaptor subunit [Candidatus Pacebacteria bacterium]|nr:efflux RND transporter periplasmic adaptor subunit [Candidatus Paceibacterota bacterium]MDD2757043.1 efflux RND transporter periplasmic adaptor subunit [Candidatus Paceibacterota bacterium]MDD3283552.1 efflux RND transporter periplasmic adaptor subunit [Candidatus Paceibacterota bacterium]MDD3969591.1 efflux RND transporter periplasmic adaptor subunit [Candidatus Paceibacterota bacterium]MDD4737863.1 efflux RND transporter periplasmic adaptor subunit [Candidatus Paceibacterota bacterium]